MNECPQARGTLVICNLVFSRSQSEGIIKDDSVDAPHVVNSCPGFPREDLLVGPTEVDSALFTLSTLSSLSSPYSAHLLMY